MKRFLLLIPFTLYGSTMDFSAEDLTMNEQEIQLSGNVRCMDRLGKSFAQQGHIHWDKKLKKFHTIQLEDDVHFEFNDRSFIDCKSIHLNLDSKRGLASDASLSAQYANKPLNIRSKTLSFDISSSNELQSVLASKRVQVLWDNEFSLLADKAEQVKLHSSVDSVFYLLHLFPKKNQFCILKHDNDIIKARSIKIDTFENVIKMLSPNGSFKKSLLGTNPNNFFHFSSQRLLWQRNENTIDLKEDVIIDDPDIGSLKTDTLLRLTFEKQDLISLLSKGKTTWKYFTLHKLFCNGTVSLSKDTRLLSIQSADNEQFTYENDTAIIRADKGEVEFEIIDTKLVPTKVELYGNVKIHEKGQKNRQAISDYALYLPLEKKILLSSSEGQRVLYRDKTQGIIMSAQQIEIISSPEVSVKGLGNMRMHFTREEKKALSQL